MKRITLVPHHLNYANTMSSLTTSPHVKNALGLSEAQTTLEGTIEFIEFIVEQEKQGKQFSRCILDENNQLIGVITLKDINKENKTCHIGTWIGHEYWGQGYNELAKKEILQIAFQDLHLEYVFAGAKVTNIRSQKAQEKLPYVRINVSNEFPEEHRKLEEQVGSECILNVIEKDSFLNWHRNQ